MRILVTNDDGVDSVNLHKLVETLGKKHEVYCVVPNTQKSACSMSLSVNKQMKTIETSLLNAYKTYTVEGSPADCVIVAIEGLGIKPDLVISGINIGLNAGYDTLYSGTVAGACEGVICGIPSIAVSQNGREVDCHNFVEFIDKNLMLLCSLASCEHILNVNYPKEKAQGVRISCVADVKYDNELVKFDENGITSFLLVPNKPQMYNPAIESDLFFLEKGYVTITPLIVNKTDKSKISSFKTISIEDKFIV